MRILNKCNKIWNIKLKINPSKSKTIKVKIIKYILIIKLNKLIYKNKRILMNNNMIQVLMLVII